MQSNENLPEIKELLWQLLRGKHIDIENARYKEIEDRFDEFKVILHSLGFDLIHDSMGFFYLQRPNKTEETTTSAKICTLFFVIVQKLQERKEGHDSLDFSYLTDRKGFDLENIISHSNLDDTLSRLLKDIDLTDDAKIEEVLDTMKKRNLVERLPTNNWRFRRSIARLERVANKYANYSEDEEE